MKLSRAIGIAALAVGTLGLSSAANATLTSYSSQPLFDAQGTITQNYGFEDFPSGQINSPGNPFTSHGVTYTSGQNEIFGGFSGHNNPSAWIATGNYVALTGTIAGINNSMFGFDLGVYDNTSLLNYTLTTNLGSYVFSNVVVPNLNTQLQTFFGYTAGPGEYFTAFSFAAQGAGSGAALDNVELGTLPINVPEPLTLSLFGAGLAGAAAMRRRQAKRA